MSRSYSSIYLEAVQLFWKMQLLPFYSLYIVLSDWEAALQMVVLSLTKCSCEPYTVQSRVLQSAVLILRVGACTEMYWSYLTNISEKWQLILVLHTWSTARQYKRIDWIVLKEINCSFDFLTATISLAKCHKCVQVVIIHSMVILERNTQLYLTRRTQNNCLHCDKI